MLIVTKESHHLRIKQHQKYCILIEKAQHDKEEARSQGDLSENFGYVEARKTIENLRKIQSNLGLNTPGLNIVDPLEEWCENPADELTETPRARLGTIVQIERDGICETLLLGGAWDGDLENPKVIAYTSPLAKAIIAKAPNYQTILEPTGEEIKLVSVAIPTKEGLEEIYQETQKNRTKLGKRQKGLGSRSEETSLEDI